MQPETAPAMGSKHLRLKEHIRSQLSRRICAHRIMFGQLRGVHIITSWHDYPGAILGRTERPLLNWFHRNVSIGQTWIDVGAHYGYTAIALARLVGPAGRVFAFEPVPVTANCVTCTKELNRLSQLTVVPFGLDSDPAMKTRTLPTARGMADSTIPSGGRGQEISVSSFDSLWPSLCGADSTVHGVKIDVQGMELGVLRGMRQALRRHHPAVIVEFHSGVDRHAVIETLDESGYERLAEPIEPDESHTRPQYRDNCSYAFRAKR